MKKFKKIILCTCLSIALLSTYGCSSSQDSSNTSTEASMTDATKSDVTDNTSEKVVEDTEKVSEEVVSEDTTENASEDTTTETVAKGDDKKTEATTEGKAENKTENTPATTQTATTQAQTTTQQSKPGNSGNNSNSQATTSHSHTWVNHTKTVHHDAQYEDQEVTKYKKEEHLFCNTCGADITNIGSDAHYAASGTMWVNGGTDENPWWVEVTRCAGCHTGSVNVPYTETEKVKVQDAYDEEIVDYQYCSGCGQRK